MYRVHEKGIYFTGLCVNGGGKNCDEFFDASQYAFFGRGSSEDVELGGLDEDDGGEQLDDGDDAISNTGDREGSASLDTTPEWADDVSDLTSSFLKLNRISPRQEGQQNAVEEGRPLSTSREAAGSPEWLYEGSPASSWLDRSIQDKEADVGDMGWWPNHQHQSIRGNDFEVSQAALPAHQPLQPHPPMRWWGGDPGLSHAAALGGAYSPTSVRQPHQVQRGAAVAPPQGLQPGQYRHPMSGLPSHSLSGGVLPTQMVYGAGQPAFSSTGPLLTPALEQPGSWLPRPSGTSGLVGNSRPQQMPLTPPQVMLQYQRPPPLHSSPPPLYGQIPAHPMHASPPPTAPHMMQKLSDGGVPGEFWDPRDQRYDPQYHTRQTLSQQRFHQQVSPPDANHGGRGSQNGWQVLRSKYMTAEEIENIVRIQWAATHSSDPYIDDYYHQAVQAKNTGGTPHGRRHFAPSHPRDMPSHTRAAAEPHAFLQVDALGRVPFSSIRRPRPLLEMDPAMVDGMGIGGGENGNGDISIESMSSQRPLEQEPMLAARIAIEDGLCLLLDVDDIDRLLVSQQHPDGGAQLRRRRQILLEGLAASLQLADPLGNPADIGAGIVNGRLMGLSPKDDLVFLRLVSLPKGRKLLTRYLQLLTPGSQLVLIVCMAVFRHLRFLFNGPQSDVSSAATSAGLAHVIALAVLNMDLLSLSACLLSVVSMAEPPPLRPMGSPSGDGATVILRSVLERANIVRRDRNALYILQNLNIWQHAFDAFFALLTKYCTNKYDSVIHSLMMSYPGNIPAINAAADEALKKEIPVELLQATLPHTSELQRKLLYDLITKGAGAMSGLSSGANADSRTSNTATVRG
ncbi:unnamed protein product [Sphagnum troendelagicum]|uniref:Topoisomerase II-associated protein PAT1 n=1 Tax=Sphagnum troendelagicum TaxID=128251 RepID=A0ABP0TR64_9BRYO